MSFLGGLANFDKKLYGGLLNPAGSLGGLFDQGDDPGKAQLAQVLAQIEKAKGESRIGYAQAASQQRRAIPLIKQSFDQASQNALKLAENTKRTVMRQQPAALTGAQMGADSTGFVGGNMGRLRSRAVYANTANALSQIDDLAAQHQDQLATQQAGALGSIQGNLADLEAAGANANSGLTTSAANAIAGVQHIPKKSIWDLLGGVAKVAAPFAALA
jgi:hypothetical protein